MENRLFLNSKGLEKEPGPVQIKTALSEYGMKDLSEKTIYIVSFPEYEVDEKILRNCIEILGFQKENVRFSRFNFPDFKFVPKKPECCIRNFLITEILKKEIYCSAAEIGDTFQTPFF